ncbi:hypothetical protein [Nocardia alni]|uniref:hypothetical protein n=1 Tax=Nocardia alni TaxID=2815723 RepID=UPI001C240618|nr:hypothetical protein [Nocardia alni]
MYTYPELVRSVDLSVMTRVMLEGDGSTTLMLQTLIGSKLRAETLPSEADCVSDRVSVYLSAVFRGDEYPDLAIRRSRLFDGFDNLVSENIIVYRRSDRDVLIPRDDTPFGVHTRDSGMYERRRMLAHGVTGKRFGMLPEGAPGRAYEIEFSSGEKVLVNEVFNPGVIYEET